MAKKKRVLKLNPNGLLGGVSKRQEALDAIMGDEPKPKIKPKKKPKPKKKEKHGATYE